jgi:hypothetical protein
MVFALRGESLMHIFTYAAKGCSWVVIVKKIILLALVTFDVIVVTVWISVARVFLFCYHHFMFYLADDSISFDEQMPISSHVLNSCLCFYNYLRFLG